MNAYSIRVTLITDRHMHASNELVDQFSLEVSVPHDRILPFKSRIFKSSGDEFTL
jgi:hypothetical protein